MQIIGETITLPYADEEMRLKIALPVSQTLSAARRRSGQSVEQVSKLTRFPAHFIEALEEGAFSEFAAPIYLFGAVRAFALVVGIDAEEAVAAARAEVADRTINWRRGPWMS